MKNTISVIIPSYKTDYMTMSRTIKSVINQELLPSEIIIVDDNGGDEYTEGNKHIESEFKNNLVKLICNGKNKGASYTRNYGIKEAKGDFIAFLDSDDMWDKSYLKLISDIIKVNNAKFITSNYQIVHEDGTLPPAFNEKDFPCGNIEQTMFYRDIVGPTSTVVVERKTIIEAGLFDENLPARQDYDMWLRVCKLVPLYYNYKSSVLVYRDGHPSISSSYIRNVKGTQMVLDKILFNNKFSIVEQQVIKASHLKYMALTCILCNAYYESRKYSKASLSYKFDSSLFIWHILTYTPAFFSFIRYIRKQVLYKKTYLKNYYHEGLH